MHPEAIFDSLSIAHKLDDLLDGFEQNEIHLFAYFSAILFHYAGNPVDDWGYKFVISESGFPHSKALSDAIERNEMNGFFEEGNTFTIISGRGTDQYYKFAKFPTYKKREEYIEAACTTSVIIPYYETKKALLNDPNIQKAIEVENQDWISFNYEQLQNITSQLGAPVGDLIIPAIAWIEILLKNQKIK